VEFEFANGVTTAGGNGPPPAAAVSLAPGPTDAYATVTRVPWVGNVRVGLQKEPFSLEALGSHRWLTFMERSYLFDAAPMGAFSNNGRSVGVSVFRTWANSRAYSAVGAFKNAANAFGFAQGAGEYAATGRLGFLPVWSPDQKAYWFVGGAMSYRDPVDGQVRVRVRNSVRAAPGPLLNVIADTGPITASSQTLFNLQTAAVSGPLTIQAEYLANLVNGARVGAGPDLGTVPFQGYYVEALYFLTGDSRPWDAANARFGRVVPRRNFGFAHGKWCGGWGAWELGVRYTFLDLTEGGVFGGRLRDATLGLNWYWNPNVKMQFNYDYVYRDESGNPFVKGSIHSFGTRLAVEF
jgi:phosphate-selective porin OprO/OprP